MIRTSDGRSRSERTTAETLALLKKDINALSKEEKETLVLALKQIARGQQPGEQAEPPILQVFTDAEWEREPVDIETFVRDEYYLGKTCDMLYPKLLDDMKELFSGGYRECVLSGSIGWGKCCTFNSFWSDGVTGTKVSIADVVGQEAVVPTLRNSVVGTATASRVWASGRKLCARLTLASGQWFEGSLDHPVLTARGYRELGVLTSEDFVAAARTLPAPLRPLEIPDEHVATLAYLLADGAMTGSPTSTRYCKGNPVLVADFKRCVPHVPGFTAFGYEARVRNAFYVEALGIAPWTAEWGIRTLSRHKRAPPKLFGLDNRQLALFLRILLSDGNVYTGTPRKIEVAFASEGLIDDVQYLLRRFGVVARKTFAPKSIKADDGSKDFYDAWRLQIADAPTQIAFMERVGPIAGLEEQCVLLLAQACATTSNPNWDVVPITRKELKEIRSETGPHKNEAWAAVASLAEGSCMGRDKFIRLCEHLKYKGEYSRFATMDVVWERVSSVEPIGEQDVYDLTVPETGNFVANGIIVHNTFFASIGICRLLYELSCMRDPQRSYGLAAGSIIAIACFSVNEMLAMKVVFENITNKLQASPYFKEHLPYEVTKKEMRFNTKKLWLAARASTEGSALGLNSIGALVDECLHPDSYVLLADGGLSRVADLCARGTSVAVTTLDFERGVPVSAQAFFKRSTNQECFELLLDSGSTLRASANHPVAVRREGVLRFITIRDIIDGEEIVEFGTLDRRAPQTTRREDAGVLGGGAYGALFEGSTGEGAYACEGAMCGGGYQAAAAGEGGGEPYVREAAVRGAEVVDRCFSARAQGECRDTRQDVGGTQGQEDAHGGVQATPRGAKPHPRLPAYRGDQTQDFGVQRVAASERGLSLPSVCGDHEDRQTRAPFYLGTAGDRDSGRGYECEDLLLRAAVGAVRVGGSAPSNAPRLPGDTAGRYHQDCRSKTQGVCSTCEGASEDGGRSRVLRNARLGIRGAGRALSVARLVSQRSLGVCPTYDVSVPGYEVFVADGVLVHNTNFMPDVPKSLRGRLGAEVTGRAETLYNQIKRRMKSRFSRQGQLPGMIFVVSSKKTKGDFTAKLVEASRNDPSVFARDYAQWSVKPEADFTVERFPVLCGNESTPSKILTCDEAVTIRARGLDEGIVILDVPEEFRVDFENDLEGAIRDIGGVSTVSISPFIQRREKIIEAVDHRYSHPFSTLEYEVGTSASFLWGKMSQAHKNRYGEVEFLPHINPKATRHIHIDPSLRKDATGFVMAHVAGWKDVIRRKDGKVHTERHPIYLVDVALRVLPPSAGEIDLGDVRQLIYMLKEKGYRISQVTMDRFNSADTLQQLRKQGYNAEVLSVDLKLEPYENLKTALYENRVVVYDYPPLLDELRQLERDYIKNKIDHPVTGTKDIADALAGACFTLSTAKNRDALPILPGLSYSPGDVQPRTYGASGGLPILVGDGMGDDDGWSDL